MFSLQRCVLSPTDLGREPWPESSVDPPDGQRMVECIAFVVTYMCTLRGIT